MKKTVIILAITLLTGCAIVPIAPYGAYDPPYAPPYYAPPAHGYYGSGYYRPSYNGYYGGRRYGYHRGYGHHW